MSCLQEKEGMLSSTHYATLRRNLVIMNLLCRIAARNSGLNLTVSV